MLPKRLFAIVTVAMLLFATHECNALVVDGNRIMDQDMGENLCALTFDDGPSNFTPHLLDMLRDYGIPATFFMLGSNARRLPGVVRRVAAEGHEIGNHTFSHPNLHHLSFEQQKEQIGLTESIFRKIGVTSLYMRPPYGNYDERTIEILREHGLKLIMWSMDSKDWKHLPADYSKLRSTRGTVYENGNLRGVFLFHDIHKSTVDDLPRIIANLRAGGCQRFVTMSEYLAGVLDDEPGMLMTRHPPKTGHAALGKPDNASQNSLGDIPLARCSRPFDQPEQVAHNADDTREADAKKVDEAMPVVLTPKPVG